jgi:uncharacterized membrane protein
LVNLRLFTSHFIVRYDYPSPTLTPPLPSPLSASRINPVGKILEAVFFIFHSRVWRIYSEQFHHTALTLRIAKIKSHSIGIAPKRMRTLASLRQAMLAAAAP